MTVKTLEPETVEAYRHIPNGTVALRSHLLGRENREPLLFGMDGALRYAKAYAKRFESKLSEDYVLGPAWLKWVTGLRELLNGDGAVAMELGITTDSKDNGVIEETFWQAMSAAGFTEADL